MSGELERSTIEWFEVDLPVRGYSVSLKQIKDAYTELKILNCREAERILSTLARPSDKSEQESHDHLGELRRNAFNLTVSIIGSDDNITKYGEDEHIFDNADLPFPIKTIYFTNENA